MKAWTMMSCLEDTKTKKVHYDLNLKEDNVYLAYLVDMVEGLMASFG